MQADRPRSSRPALALAAAPAAGAGPGIASKVSSPGTPTEGGDGPDFVPGPAANVASRGFSHVGGLQTHGTAVGAGVGGGTTGGGGAAARRA